jgi:hypothetical protein
MVRPHVVLLGPQRLQPTLAGVVESLGISGRIAAVTAGWEEREGEDQELSAHLEGRTINLRLYERAEDAYRVDAELFAAVRGRRAALRRMQELYRVRLAHAAECARDLVRRRGEAGEPEWIEPEISGAIEGLRALDAEHVRRIGSLHVEYDRRWTPRERPAVAKHVAELASILEGCSALCVAGGHVAVLLDRLRLFGVLDLLRAQPVIAWSAGAMALSERIVVFHDRPPQGAGDAEVLEAGLGAHPRLVALPHAERRLDLGQRARVELFARRFEPAWCVTLDPRSRIDWRDGRWRAVAGVRKLEDRGDVVEMALEGAAR